MRLKCASALNVARGGKTTEAVLATEIRLATITQSGRTLTLQYCQATESLDGLYVDAVDSCGWQRPLATSSATVFTSVSMGIGCTTEN